MRIALCYRGRAAGYSKGTKTQPFHGQFEKVKKHIGQGHDVDVFVHCWSPSVKEKLLSIYNPVSYIFEEEKIFDDNFKFGMENINKDPKKLKKIKSMWSVNHRLSVAYSIAESVKLKKKYEDENKFKYDAVFLLRYDIDFFNNFDYSVIDDNPEALIYSIPMRTQENGVRTGFDYYRANCKYTGLNIWDHWFAGSSKAMDILINSFDTIHNDEWIWKNRRASMHQTWDRFFQLEELPKAYIKPYKMPPDNQPISELTRHRLAREARQN